MKTLKSYAKLMRLDKPIGTLLLLWPTLWGLWFAAKGIPPFHILWVFILGTFLMRSAGCILNDYADRDFDPWVTRTADRPMAMGQVNPKTALILASGISFLAFLLVLPLPGWWLSFPALFIAGSYPYIKRFFPIPQAYLGIAFSFGIPMGFFAISEHFSWITWVLFLANFFWIMAYDTEYAMVDRKDDQLLGIYTSALTFGRFDICLVMLCYALFLSLLIGIGLWEERGLFYYGGLSVALICFIYHYFLIRHRETVSCFKAFLHNNWIGLSIFLGIALDFWKQIYF